MLCRNPYQVGLSLFPCGQCEPCLVNRKRIWSHRIMLESFAHARNTFVTLTYDDKHLPMVDGIPTLDPTHTRDWLKRIRKSYEPQRLRYFLVGEYGDEKERPHYHAVLFGYPTCLNGQTNLVDPVCCSVCTAVQETWPFGSVQLLPLRDNLARYICGYVTKKMTSPTDLRLGGRHPEFRRMSTGRSEGGLGAIAMETVSTAMMRSRWKNAPDVPGTLTHSGRDLPLGRYLRNRLRSARGQEQRAPRNLAHEQEMLAVLRNSFSTPGRSLKDQYVADTQTKYDRWKARRTLFELQPKKGKTL